MTSSRWPPETEVDHRRAEELSDGEMEAEEDDAIDTEAGQAEDGVTMMMTEIHAFSRDDNVAKEEKKKNKKKKKKKEKKKGRCYRYRGRASGRVSSSVVGRTGAGCRRRCRLSQEEDTDRVFTRANTSARVDF